MDWSRDLWNSRNWSSRSSTWFLRESLVKTPIAFVSRRRCSREPRSSVATFGDGAAGGAADGGAAGVGAAGVCASGAGAAGVGDAGAAGLGAVCVGAVVTFGAVVSGAGCGDWTGGADAAAFGGWARGSVGVSTGR